MPALRPTMAAALSAVAAILPNPSLAGGLFEDSVATLLRSDRATVEVSTGYLAGEAKEIVNDIPGSAFRLSQLNWRIDSAFVVGARGALRPLEWLTLRARAWAHVLSDNTMDDYDWLAGNIGQHSWSHWSHHKDTSLTRAWQGDFSAAARVWGDDSLAITAIGGYRYMTAKWNAKGGSFVYSTNAFYDTVGVFNPGQIGIAYQQWWHTPYFGVGVAYTNGNLALTGEFVGSPWALGRDKDYHALRQVLFEEAFEPTQMLGVALGAEYRLSALFSVTGRFEYQSYFKASGGTRFTDAVTGAIMKFPKPAGEGDLDTLLLSLGVKARL